MCLKLNRYELCSISPVIILVFVFFPPWGISKTCKYIIELCIIQLLCRIEKSSFFNQQDKMMLGQYLQHTGTCEDPALVGRKASFVIHMQAHKTVHITKGGIYCLGRYMHFTPEAYN